MTEVLLELLALSFYLMPLVIITCNKASPDEPSSSRRNYGGASVSDHFLRTMLFIINVPQCWLL